MIFFYRKSFIIYVALFLLAFIPVVGYSQIVNPVKWDYTVNISDNNEAELVFKATIDKAWHLYSLQPGSLDVNPTTFTFDPSNDYNRIDSVQQVGSPVKKKEPVFDNAELSFFEKEAVFKQKIKIKSDHAFVVKGQVSFQACNESQCIFPPPTDFEITVDVKKKDKILADNTISTENNSDQSFIGIFIKGFLGGLAALFTPCVFPIIPLTVSFFTKQSKTRAKGIANASIYSLAIILIYVLLGMAVTLIFGSDALNALSTSVWFNLAFFVLLVVFAISFLGAFEITLPSSFVNKVDAQSDRGGLIGIFFMAFTLSLVSFSCTGPIIGTLLVDAAVNGNIKGPFWGMFGFSTALALPFGLFAAFPGWLNSLPKSGGWLNSVKVVLGFLELALALKFASNADLVVQAGIITREVFLVLWIIIFGLMGVYLLGWIKFPHDSELKHLSIVRLFFAAIALSFTFYLIPGLWGAPLKLISGFPPPAFYSESPEGFSSSKSITILDGKQIQKKKEHCPNNLPCFHDYDEALAYAKQVGKPLMIDFTGWACVNCRKMEEKVWSDPEVDKRLRNDVILVSLYVDDKTELPADQQTIKKIGERDFKIKTIGNKWSYFQASHYQTNTQPQYILLDNNEQLLSSPISYNPDIQNYINWLDEAKSEFEKRNKK